MRTLGDSGVGTNSKAIAQQLGSTPWLQTASAEARQWYIANSVQQRLAFKRKRLETLKARAHAEE